MALKVSIVGAGIAGLCASITLRQAGHQVEVYEKSQFASEIGAALTVTPNGARVLSQFGFSFSAARAVKIDAWNVVRGDNLEHLAKVDLSSAEETFGAAIWAIHRMDLHRELRRLATSASEPGCPVKIHLSSEVIDASPDGSITLRDQNKRNADLVIAADGVHSILRAVVAGKKVLPPESTGLSAFRFLIDTVKFQESASLSTTLQKKGPGATLLADTTDVVKERHIMWYPCRNGETQNFVGIHPEREVVANDEEAVKASMLEEFDHFSPDMLEIIRKSSHVKSWPLCVHEPLPRWFNGRIVLIGDAAHPMLPFGGQGSNSAMEDAGALGYLFKGVDDSTLIDERLCLFERARTARASRLQILSSVRAGKEKDVEEELRRYADPPGSSTQTIFFLSLMSIGPIIDLEAGVPSTMVERTVHDYSYDVFKNCEELWKARAEMQET